MGKFKVGDRVRRIGSDNFDDFRVGDTGEVVSVESGSECYVRSDRSGVERFNYTEYLELVEPKWQPKVGDRVRFVRDSTAGGARFGTEGEAADVVSTARETSGGRYALDVKLDNDRIGFFPAAYLDDLEPLPVAAEAQPAPLTIEAGRYYKTRDGRKVGPIARGRMVSDAWYWEAPSADLEYECAWYRNGSFFSSEEHKMDLIAEWVDEPAEHPAFAVAASNDNAAQVKFKVGDRIKGSAPGIGPVTGAVVEVDADDDDMTYFVLPDGKEYPFWVYNNTVEAADPAVPAIVALIEDGQPKPATRPYVHATEESAANEADRLADLHKGQEFAVFVLTSSRKRAAPAYAFEWQRLAAKGEKIAAIKELRAVTGMPLRQSKDVVEHFVDKPYGEIAA